MHFFHHSLSLCPPLAPPKNALTVLGYKWIFFSLSVASLLLGGRSSMVHCYIRKTCFKCTHRSLFALPISHEYIFFVSIFVVVVVTVAHSPCCRRHTNKKQQHEEGNWNYMWRGMITIDCERAREDLHRIYRWQFNRDEEEREKVCWSGFPCSTKEGLDEKCETHCRKSLIIEHAFSSSSDNLLCVQKTKESEQTSQQPISRDDVLCNSLRQFCFLLHFFFDQKGRLTWNLTMREFVTYLVRFNLLDEWAELLKHNISSHWGRQFFGLFMELCTRASTWKLYFFLWRWMKQHQSEWEPKRGLK